MKHRIKEVLPSEWRVTLTTTSADLNDDIRWERTYLASADRWYHVLTAEERTQVPLAPLLLRDWSLELKDHVVPACRLPSSLSTIDSKFY